MKREEEKENKKQSNPYKYVLYYKNVIGTFNTAISKGITINMDDYAQTICNLAIVLYNNGRYEEALATVTVSPPPPNAQYINLSILLNTRKVLYYNLGVVYIGKKDFPSALKNLRESNEISQEVNTLYNIGYVENLQKHFEAAHNYYDKAFQLASKSRQNTLVIHKAIKNNITEYFIDLCHTNPMNKFESLAGRETTYKNIYEQLPHSCLKHAKYLFSQSIPVSDVRKSITDVNTAVLMFNRLAKLYSQVTEESRQQLLSLKVQVSHDYWDLLNTYSYIKTKQCLPSYEVDERLDDTSAILGSRVELLEESFSEKPSVRKLLKEFTDNQPCELILEYLFSDYDTIVNITLEYLGEEDICTQMAGLIQDKLPIEGGF